MEINVTFTKIFNFIQAAKQIKVLLSRNEIILVRLKLDIARVNIYLSFKIQARGDQEINIPQLFSIFYLCYILVVRSIWFSGGPGGECLIGGRREVMKDETGFNR